MVLCLLRHFGQGIASDPRSARLTGESASRLSSKIIRLNGAFGWLQVVDQTKEVLARTRRSELAKLGLAWVALGKEMGLFHAIAI